MGSVGSGASSQRPITMRSVGTRTTPNGPLVAALPPASTRRRLDDRSFSAERIPGPSTKTKGVSADEHSYNAERDFHANARNHAQTERAAAHNANRQQMLNGERLVANVVFANGARREGHRRGESLDLCGNNIVLNNDKNGSHQAPPQPQHKDKSKAKPNNHNPPNILPVSGKLEHAQTNDSLVRPSAFKPVVPKSFHSMQNLVCPLQSSSGTAGGPGSSGSGGEKGGPNASGPQWDQDSPGSRGTHAGAGRAGQGSLSDSGRNSLTSLPTYTGSSYGPPPALGPLSASTSHINRLGTVALDKLDKPGYQNGISASDSGRSSSGKSSSSYQRLSHLSDAPAPLRPSPSSDDVIQDLEERLWEREQEVSEVIHMRRNLDQSEAAIVQVFEEKQRVWEHEMEELRQNYAGRLQQVTRRAQRTQQALQAQIARLQQDKRRLQDEMTLLLAQREELEKKCLDFRKEQADILPRLEETKWEVCQKVGEISLLKQQLRESQGEVTQRAGEMVALRGQLKDLNAQLREREETEISLKESFCTKTLELERCEAELQTMLAEVTVLRDKLSAFEMEVARLKKALSELSSSSSRSSEPSLTDMGQLVASRSRERLLSPPETPTSLPVLPAPDPLLTLQSDDSKVQWQESGDLRRQLERLQGELRLERQQREQQALTFAQERQTWQDEKERVLKYQAQLQLSYVEMLQKNQALEERVDKLGAQIATPSLPEPPVSVSISLTSPTPPAEEKKLPEMHQLAPPWPVSTRLERIESTEI
ncbi:leucine zipper putative tumor suppressor 3-like isoform X1 [Sinocyclocheilus grahami]|uniref:leucine zipper putative tumor suppressor 3-like isoform X1 n=1 Tax=Sinocyclocheilus grahami TaxID=75366 RepID=UPI0007ACE58A|nr:PREDICTED: leucine zipper putative tumor suppressor 3-like isoform X1 [Sinocyclocheilus grahami]XP_016116461.1 PREDICTED: leucine zipper putative tumor suppressor 3-like isoform X1 [Sinocyclocheilus grahami]XP_016116462.1 PREDICTED: leucine zipper putative tumor suppressor 3-like isoform X1 [Sinocyclocheilus grahami]